MQRIEITREEFASSLGLEPDPLAEKVTLCFGDIPLVEYVFVEADEEDHLSAHRRWEIEELERLHKLNA